MNPCKDFSFLKLIIYKMFLVSVLLLSNQALALKPFSPTPEEVRMLPPFCAARLGAPGAAGAADLWKQRLGANNYIHIHHYCYALNFMNRARFETNKADRKHYLNEAIGNFDYVLKRWSPNYQLSKSARTYKLQAESMLRTN